LRITCDLNGSKKLGTISLCGFEIISKYKSSPEILPYATCCIVYCALDCIKRSTIQVHVYISDFLTLMESERVSIWDTDELNANIYFYTNGALIHTSLDAVRSKFIYFVYFLSPLNQYSLLPLTIITFLSFHFAYIHF
jgi:hypothetical protein